MKRSRSKLHILMITLVLITTFFVSACKKDDSNDDVTNVSGIEEQGSQEGKDTEQVENRENPEDPENSGGVSSEEDSSSEEDALRVHYGTVEVIQEVIYEEDFEETSHEFVGRGAATVEVVNGKSTAGENSLFVSGRTAAWNGATVNLSDRIQAKETYLISANVMYEEGPATMQIDCKVEKNGSSYLDFASTMAKKGEWTPITGQIIIPEDTTTANVYFETGFTEGDLLDFYIDDIVITSEVATVERGELPSLKEVYKDQFSMGVAATVSEILEYRQGLIKEQFNSMTPGNELKADAVLDYATCISDPKYDESPAVKFTAVEPILKFAQEAGIPVRGHTLVWHSQTPRWFFAEGYSQAEDAPLVSKELMLKRMENYMKQVLEYTQENYPGVIYSWDVVNEAVLPGDGDPDGLRVKDSLWYQVIGPEFIEKAFEYARKYADEDVTLFYNDYNTEEKGKLLAIYNLVERLSEKGIIDGIGLQTHISIDSPSLIDIESSIRKYGELGLEIQITELDMDMKDDTEEELMRQGKRYKRIFTLLKNLDETGAANITNVTFWGLSDDISWLIKPGVPSYPLLFDKYLIQKPAFWGTVLSPDIPLF